MFGAGWIAAQRAQRALIGAGGTTEAKIDPAGIERLQRALNRSATIKGAWFGSITPPEPTRIVFVPPAI